MPADRPDDVLQLMAARRVWFGEARCPGRELFYLGCVTAVGSEKANPGLLALWERRRPDPSPEIVSVTPGMLVARERDFTA